MSDKATLLRLLRENDHKAVVSLFDSVRDEALRILDGVETSDIDGSKQDFNNPDFNNH